MHPAASKALFDAEAQKLSGNRPLLDANGWTLHEAAYPHLRISMRHRPTTKDVTFQFECSDWDEQPPALSVVDAETGAVLGGAAWPRGGGGHWHQSGSPLGGGGFCCMAGIREYHLHPSHLNDKWDNYRGRPGFTLVEIILKVSAALQHADV